MNLDEILEIALNEAEEQYGERVHSRKILPIETHGQHPCLIYPDNNSIKVLVSAKCRDEKHRAYYQLGHESIHILSPVSIGVVTVLEEGLATAFSHELMEKRTQVKWETSGCEKYDHAWGLVNQLNELSGSALKDIYSTFKRFSPLNLDELLNIVPSIQRELASELCTSFQVWEPCS